MFDRTAQYLLNVLVAVDQLANALLAGWCDETLSSRAYRMDLKDQPMWGGMANIIDILFFWERNPGHCERAYEAEARRWQLPPEFRTRNTSIYYPPGADPTNE